MSTEQLLAARKRVQVSVYYTERCPHCTAARRFLVQNGIRFEGHDIERDRSARSRQRLLNPQGSVPTFDIDGQVLVGFNAERVASTIDRAAQRRLAR